jgi:hypothetical protein
MYQLIDIVCEIELYYLFTVTNLLVHFVVKFTVL